MLKILPYIIAAIFVGSTASAKSCLGFPRVEGFKSELKNFCVGLVADSQVGWSAPRQLLFLNNAKLLVSDFGAWKNPKLGKVWQIDIQSGEAETIYSKGRLTHGLGLDSLGRLLIGDADKIIRLNGGKKTVVVDDLPTEGRHPLSHFIVLPNNDLIINVGAPSDHCKQEMGNGWKCFTRDSEAGVYRYTYDPSTDSYFHIPLQLGKGLRNSMALLYNPVLEVIYQAENNVDVRGTPEEFNQLPVETHEPVDFGWPYCVGMGQQASYMKASLHAFCTQRSEQPLFLIPGHSAPLDMDYYFSDLFPEISDTIIMGWHGHTRMDEQALVAYQVDHQLAPVIDSPVRNSYAVVLSGVNSRTGEKLRPVGLTVDDLGNIWFVDDKTKKLYVLSSSNGDEAETDGPSINWEEENAKQVENMSLQALQSFDEVYNSFRSVQTCDQCHGKELFPRDSKQALVELLNKRWLTFGGNSVGMPFIERMSGPTSPQTMPPQPALPFSIEHPAEFGRIKHWVESYLQ